PDGFDIELSRRDLLEDLRTTVWIPPPRIHPDQWRPVRRPRWVVTVAAIVGGDCLQHGCPLVSGRLARRAGPGAVEASRLRVPEEVHLCGGRARARQVEPPGARR